MGECTSTTGPESKWTGRRRHPPRRRPRKKPVSLKADNESAFEAVREVDSGTITIGTGPPVSCLLPAGIEGGAETAEGRHQATVSAEVVAMAKDIEQPRAGERVTLEYQGKTQSLVVQPESVAIAGSGSIYTFIIGK